MSPRTGICADDPGPRSGRIDLVTPLFGRAALPPEAIKLEELDWTGLQVLRVVDGGVDDAEGVVEFIAHWRDLDGSTGALRESSLFRRRAGRWFYVSEER